MRRGQQGTAALVLAETSPHYAPNSTGAGPAPTCLTERPDVTPSSLPPGTAIRLTCWGTRGSVPSPGAASVRYGGNTSCIEIDTGTDRRIIFDAGTGIIPLGHRLTESAGAPRIELFLTHFHWDHIQGLPFFTPLRNPEARIRIHAETDTHTDTQELLDAQMRAPYFPVSLQEMAARVEYRRIGFDDRVDDDVVISAIRVRHPGFTCGFRIRCRGTSIVYIPDNEPSHDAYPLPASWDEQLTEFMRGADLLLHDAMFTREEYESRRGWGHATFEQAVALAQRAGVARLLLFHHDPARTDDQLDAIVQRLQRDSFDAGYPLVIEAAAEGRVIPLPLGQTQPTP